DDPTPVTTAAAFSRKVADVEREAVTDVALWATIARSGGLDAVEPLVAAGACGFKVSTFGTHPIRFPRIPDGALYLAMHPLRGPPHRLPRRERGGGAGAATGPRGPGPFGSGRPGGQPSAGLRDGGDRPGAGVRAGYWSQGAHRPRHDGTVVHPGRACSRRRSR